MAALTLRPWTRGTPDTSSLKDILARVHVDRGGFRSITEASLQEEIAAEGALDLSDEDDEDDEDDAKEEDPSSAKPSTRDELYKAREAMLRGVDAAHNESMIALDFVSLLLTHTAPELGRLSLSPNLKQQLPLNVLGHDVWHKMPQNKARTAQDELIAINVRMEGLQQSADGLLAAASRLEENVRKETQFWDQILSITENGWNVCKIPGQQHRLGVTYGFSESAPEFSRRGIAALHATSAGDITLERSIGSKPSAMRVKLQRDGLVVGISRTPALLDDGETTLEARIRHARNSLFDEELYHELIRESRTQTSLGVGMSGNAIVFRPAVTDLPHGAEVVLELVSLDDVRDETSEPREQDSMAQGIAIAARLLLSQAHREKARKRSAIPPLLSERKEERSTLPIMRPVMAFLLHQAAIHRINAYVAGIASSMSAASIEHTVQPAAFTLSEAMGARGVEDLTNTLTQCWTSEATLSISDKHLTMRLETTLAHVFGTVYALVNIDGGVTQFTDQEHLRHACDAVVASRLARDLKSSDVLHGWTCNVREALLTRLDDSEVDGEAGSLSLSTPTTKVSWRTQDDTGESFQVAWARLSEQSQDHR
ncbi:RNA polymerase II mediator complex subunit [Teratosphaeriaceae sp. CCFEE 6253]|nr:RNA polymerase II mediator complex subunit [Teratosphaeriaceae sp. CCFEE 6253]